MEIIKTMAIGAVALIVLTYIKLGYVLTTFNPTHKVDVDVNITSLVVLHQLAVKTCGEQYTHNVVKRIVPKGPFTGGQAFVLHTIKDIKREAMKEHDFLQKNKFCSLLTQEISVLLEYRCTNANKVHYNGKCTASLLLR